MLGMVYCWVYHIAYCLKWEASWIMINKETLWLVSIWCYNHLPLMIQPANMQTDWHLVTCQPFTTIYHGFMMSIHIFGRIYNPNATEMYWMYWLLDVIGVFPRKKCDRSEPTNSYICGTQVRSKNSLAIATGGWCLWTHDVPELHPSPGKGESWSFLGIIEKGLGNWKLWYNIMLGGTRSLWLHDAFTAY